MNPRYSERMRRRWADPVERARMTAAIAEGKARSTTHNGRKNPKGAQVGCLRSVGARFDDETFEKLKAQSSASGKAIAELIRTYVEWGLETEEGASR